MKSLTAAEMREVDRLTAERHGVPSLQLMENAGTQVVDILRGEIPRLSEKRVSILCGKGNNGGDGFVVARLLHEIGLNPVVFLFAKPQDVRGDAAVNLDRWVQAGGKLTEIDGATAWEAARSAALSASVLVDSLLGTGLKGPAEGLIAQAIVDLSSCAQEACTVAVDIPSGLPSDGEIAEGPVVRANLTITFTAPKLGQLISPDCASVGRLFVRSIGSPPELVDQIGKGNVRWLEPREFQSLPLRRIPDANKGNFGHALIVAGSRGKTGAAVLAGTAALRSGAGLATVATPDVVIPIVSSFLPDLMTEPLESTEAGSVALRSLEYGRFSRLLQGKTVLAIGPGLSTHPDTQQFIRSVIAECSLPIVLDADGLNAFVSDPTALKTRRTRSLVLTPHPGEMSRLIGRSAAEIQTKRLETARQAAADWNAWIVLKGFHTVVASPDGQAFVNTTGTPGMAKAGSGDVLTGILAGLTAQCQTENWGRVLGFGVYVHGLAGELAAKRKGVISMMASDLLECLPDAISQTMNERNCG